MSLCYFRDHDKKCGYQLINQYWNLSVMLQLSKVSILWLLFDTTRLKKTEYVQTFKIYNQIFT